jgi:E1-E2 ATPase
MDESYLTGEPFEIAKAPGSTVLSGAINGNTLLTIRATSLASNSRYAQIVSVLHESERSRPKLRRGFVQRLHPAGKYIPRGGCLRGFSLINYRHPLESGSSCRCQAAIPPSMLLTSLNPLLASTLAAILDR